MLTKTPRHFFAHQSHDGHGNLSWGAIEWPTLGLMLTCYTLWAIALFALGGLSIWLALPVLAISITLHASLQHEAIHGHPTANRLINHLTVFPALGLFIPYKRFEDVHLAHHTDPNLTDPYDDPESWYLDPMDWQRRPAWLRWILLLNNTLAGRVLIGPTLGTIGLMSSDLKAIRKGDWAILGAWLVHLLAVLPVAVAITLSPVPFWAYLIAAYFGFGIIAIRTFLEHQAHELTRGRSVIIEDRGPLALLFLNNNLHLVHHTHPTVAWYDLPRLYTRNRARYLRMNLGYRFQSYAEVIQTYAFRRKEPVPHPLMDAGADS